MRDRGQGREGIMVGMLLSKLGVPPPLFVQKGCRINAEYYINHMLAAHYVPRVKRVAGDTEFQFQQDNAAAHAAAPATQYLKKEKIKMLGGIKWPAAPLT